MKKVYFAKKEEMQANFRKIIADDPPMAKELEFYLFLTSLAGKETNTNHLILSLTIAIKLISRKYPVNISKHIDALVNDADTIRMAKQIMENVAIRMREKKNPGKLII